MKISDISQAVRDPNRVNIFVDGTFRFSLDIFQLGELGIKIGNDYSQAELTEIETESQFGKLYARALEYCLMRPHSSREIKDYLWRKTRTTKYKTRAGDVKERQGVSQSIADRVFERLSQKGYIDDESFARFWVENRNQTKGTSQRKLRAELQAKGVTGNVIDAALNDSSRSDDEEIKKIIAKKQSKYDDEQKLMAYLARQGFSYDAIRTALSSSNE